MANPLGLDVFRHFVRDVAGVTTSYRSKKNEAFLRRAFLASQIHHRKLRDDPVPLRIAEANAKRSVVCSAVENSFAGQKHRLLGLNGEKVERYSVVAH